MRTSEPGIANAAAPGGERDEIEVTPEMIEAGADELMNFPLDNLAADLKERRGAAEAVFRRMASLQNPFRGKFLRTDVKV